MGLMEIIEEKICPVVGPCHVLTLHFKLRASLFFVHNINWYEEYSFFVYVKTEYSPVIVVGYKSPSSGNE
jgi:hypothetical protein